MPREPLLCDDGTEWRLAFRHVETKKDKPMTDTVLRGMGRTSVPGRHHHCPARLELRPVGGKRKSLWPSPIFRGRVTQEQSSIHGQGLKKIRLNRRLGVRSL